MADKWEGKVAVVTGASCGMGAAIFKELAKNKIKVIGLARRLERVEAIIDELKLSENAFAFKCDVSDSESIKKAFEWIESKFGVVNILVNNAGVCKNVNILDESEEAFEKMNEVIDVNVRGLTQCTREAFRLMKKSEDYGIIINMNSITGHSLNFSDFPMNLYPATKHAVTALTEVVRQELVIAGNKKLRVTVIRRLKKAISNKSFFRVYPQGLSRLKSQSLVGFPILTTARNMF